jgi:hypothetical protein
MDADHLRRQGHAGRRMQRCTHPRTTLSSGLDRDRLHFIPDKSRWEAATDGRRSEPCRRFRFEHAHPAYHRSQGGTVSSALRQHVGVIGRGFAGTSALWQLLDRARHTDSADVPSPPTTLGPGRRCRASALERADYAPERRVVAGCGGSQLNCPRSSGDDSDRTHWRHRLRSTAAIQNHRTGHSLAASPRSYW